MPSQAQDRRDSGRGKKEVSNKGFTLIEVLVVVAVLAIITSLAIPSYRTILEKRQVTSGAEQLGAFVSAVQIEAVRRNEPIAVRYMRTDSDTWCVGLIVVDTGSTSNTPCDCTVPAGGTNACEIDGQLRVMQSTDLTYPGIMNGMDGDGAFAFDPVRGLLIEPTKAAEFEMLSENGTYALNVQVTGTGRVKACSKSNAKDVPGYQTCTTDY